MDLNIPLGLTYDDVLLIPQYSEVDTRSEIDLTTKISNQLTLGIPLITTKMDTVTGVKMCIAIGKLGGLGILPRFESVESQANKVGEVKKQTKNVAAAIGIKEGYLRRAEALVKAGANVIDIDVAHGHLLKTINVTKKIKQTFKEEITLMSGITSTYACAIDLYKAGADCLLVGVGAGATCITRVATGCGVPSVTSLLETARAARKFKKTFAPDAGIKTSGDIVKALACGASAIVSGFLFAGTKESPSKLIVKGGKKYKEYSGSASLLQKTIQTKINPEHKNYDFLKHVEGVTGLIPYTGKLKDVVASLLAGVRSGFSYCGAQNINQLWGNARFIRVTENGRYENGSHGLINPQNQQLPL